MIIELLLLFAALEPQQQVEAEVQRLQGQFNRLERRMDRQEQQLNRVEQEQQRQACSADLRT